MSKHLRLRIGAAPQPFRYQSGFTLVELMIVVILLGILAGIVIPQLSSASQDSRTSALTSQLQELRTAIAMYRAQHMDQLPNLNAGWAPLLTQTDAQGGSTGSPLFGPYLQHAPMNPISGGSTISIAAQPGIDWVWTAASGTLTATDGQGNLMNGVP